MRRWTEPTSFLVGAAAALALLASWRVPHGEGTVAVGVSLAVARSPVLELSQTGTVAQTGHLLPGRAVTKDLTIRNTRAVALRLRPRAVVVGDTRLAAALRAEVDVDGERSFSGPLAKLSERAARRFRLEPDARRHVRIRLELPPSARDVPARTLQISLTLGVEP